MTKIYYNFNNLDEYFEWFKIKEEWLNKEFREAAKDIKVL